MSTYNYTYCPYCNKLQNNILGVRQEFFYYNKYIGLKYNRCPYCNNIYSTGKKLYFQMSKEEKNKIKLIYPINILATSISLFAIILIITFIISGFIFSNNLGDYINYIFIILGILYIPCFIIAFYSAKREYEDIKKMSVDDFNIDEELKQLNN